MDKINDIAVITGEERVLAELKSLVRSNFEKFKGQERILEIRLVVNHKAPRQKPISKYHRLIFAKLGPTMIVAHHEQLNRHDVRKNIELISKGEASWKNNCLKALSQPEPIESFRTTFVELKETSKPTISDTSFSYSWSKR